MSMSSSSNNNGEIYGIPNSGWKSPSWNWGSAVGTGHDCALICRTKYQTSDSRVDLLERLLNVDDTTDTARIPLEEIKLILGLAWQKGRWDKSDGGPGGYGDVLSLMAAADRYESDVAGRAAFVEDMAERFHLIADSEEDVDGIMDLYVDAKMCAISKDEMGLDRIVGRCAGLVLKAMGFVDSGL
eukprot:CAMPEP_0195515402 /NCGR_PEP_ID=MMETSP0794_2-20130614/6477_1 /TAXON_ID=515487 /ORGANISM="Stephanopyxis turris, Strain CCMP 815" /LENGTH=184 /DNA_ID=CAMNT_0040643809 /DNA_START=242 /DNA_END=796 /DNA_ORIENTATION=+